MQININKPFTAESANDLFSLIYYLITHHKKLSLRHHNHLVYQYRASILIQ